MKIYAHKVSTKVVLDQYKMKNKHIMLILLISTISGCVSTTNLKDSDAGIFGGGFNVNKVNEHIFYIYVQTTGSLIARYEASKKFG